MAIGVVIAGVNRAGYLDNVDSGKGGQTKYTVASGQRGTASVSLRVHAGDTYAPLVGNPIGLYDQAGQRVFGGLITEIVKTNEGNTQETLYVCTCASFERLLDKHRIEPQSYFNQTAGAIFTAIFNSLPGETIILGQVDAGPVVPSAVYRHEVVTDVFNNLATDANFVWGVDPATEKLYFRAPTSVNAPFDLTGDPLTGAGVLWDTLEWDTAQQDFRSRQYITVNMQAMPTDTDLMTGDGTTTSFTLGNRVDTVTAVTILGGPASNMGTAGSLAFNDGDTITVGSVTYTVKTAIDNLSPNEVLIGSDSAGTMSNLAEAINGGPNMGTDFSNGTVPNPQCIATSNNNTITVTAIISGTSGNTIPTTTTCQPDEFSWPTDTLSNGNDGPTRAAVNGMFSGLPAANDTVTIDGIVYIFVATLDNTSSNQVLIGGTADACANNLVEAIAGAPHVAAGNDFSLPTLPHPTCVASYSGAGGLTVFAKAPGADGNNIAISAASTAFSWDNGNLTGGIPGPSQTATLQSGGSGTGTWIWTEGSDTISCTPALPNNVIAAVTYYRLGVDIIGVENTSLAQARAAVEGGSGIYQALIEEAYSIDPVANDPAAAIARANSLLASYGLLTQTLTFYTDSAGWQPGQALKVNLAPPFDSTLNGTWLTSQIDGSWIPGMPGWRCQVQAIAMSLNGRAASPDMRANSPTIIPRKATWQMLWQRLATINPRRQKPGGGLAVVAGTSAGGGGGGGGGNIPGAPPVSIVSEKTLMRQDGKWEVDVTYRRNASANSTNYLGAAVYLEDPDVSSESTIPLDGTSALDGTSNLGGDWVPIHVTDSTDDSSPVAVLVDAKNIQRNIRIYFAAYGPNTAPNLVRANAPGATPSIQVSIPVEPGAYQSGVEFTWLVSQCTVDVTDYFDQVSPDTGGAPPPCYTLLESYLPPDPTIPLPAGLSDFAGVQITYEYLNPDGTVASRVDGPFIPNAPSGDIDAVTGRAFAEYLTGGYAVGGGGTFNVYFRSQDVNGKTNTIVTGVTPMVQVEVIYPPPSQISTPDIANFVLANPRHTVLGDGTDLAQIDASWTPPDSARFAGVRFYVFKIGSSFLNPPMQIGPQQSDSVSACTLSVNNWPNVPQAWTVAAIAVGYNGQLNDDPHGPTHSPTQVWNIGPATTNNQGGDAPNITLGTCAVTPINSTSADGSQMIAFKLANWVNPDLTNPANNNWGGIKIALQFNSDPDATHLIWYDVPDKNATSFTTPPMPIIGNFQGPQTALTFYFVSKNQQGQLNAWNPAITPNLNYYWTPTFTPAPDVTSFTVDGAASSTATDIWQLDGSFVAQSTFAWNIPTSARYAGVVLYKVAVGGIAANPPVRLTSQQSNVDTHFLLQIPTIPNPAQTWTVAAISVDVNGVLSDDPSKYGAGLHSPTVTWTLGPPGPGGAGTDYAPLVTLGTTSVTPTTSVSGDGVGMVSFAVGSWTNPTSNNFGQAEVAMVINGQVNNAVYWKVPKGATSFTTPAMPSFGNIGANVPVAFYILSDNPQGQRNQLIPGTTPVINYTYVPSAGAVIPARSGWFSSEFSWPTSGSFQAQQFAAQKIYVGDQLIVGGAPTSFAGQTGGLNGQIAVKKAGGALVAWMGVSTPQTGEAGQGGVSGIYGAWFAQLYVGADSPLHAPVWINNAGIVMIGGIDSYTTDPSTGQPANHAGSTYPYISIRDATGLEKGRIGAKLNVASGQPGDNLGGSPPGITEGAWFTQFAAGGSNISNWCFSITPDGSNPLGSQVQIRNVYLFNIDYPAVSSTVSNQHYSVTFGNSVWTTAGMASASWQFPGFVIREVDNASNLFGATFISRGLVLRGTQSQSYPVLVSLVTFNGQSSGSDTPGVFWGELAMYSSNSPYNRTVYINSGSASSGNGAITTADVNGNALFIADQNGSISGKSFWVLGYGEVIGADGSWMGKAMPLPTSPTFTFVTSTQGFNVGANGSYQLNGTQVIDFQRNTNFNICTAASYSVGSSPGQSGVFHINDQNNVQRTVTFTNGIITQIV